MSFISFHAFHPFILRYDCLGYDLLVFAYYLSFVSVLYLRLYLWLGNDSSVQIPADSLSRLPLLIFCVL